MDSISITDCHDFFPLPSTEITVFRSRKKIICGKFSVRCVADSREQRAGGVLEGSQAEVTAQFATWDKTRRAPLTCICSNVNVGISDASVFGSK